MNTRALVSAVSVASALVLSVQSALSAPITVPSGDVAALTNALKTCATWSTVVLEAGEYDLSCLTNAPMGENTSYQGRSLLSLTTGVTLKGNTGKPEDVVLKGCGKFRILQHANGCTIKDLTMTGGRAEEGSFPAGGAVFATGSAISITNCRFLFNFAAVGGGAVYSDNCVNCLFYGNQSGPSWNKGGGAGYLGTYDNCQFFCNTNLYEWAEGGALGYATKVSGCTVVSNFSGYCGGGLCNCKNVSDCTISYNAAVGTHNARGGGAYGCGVVTNCTIVGNAAASFGFGLCDTGAYGSRFFFNGATHFSKDLKTCDFRKCTFVGSAISGAGEISDCTISAISNVTAIVDNSHYGSRTYYISYAFDSCQLFRNTLITGCWITNVANQAAFYSISTSVRLENCTIADNLFHYLMRGYNGDLSATYVNTVIAANTRTAQGARGDVSGYESPNTYMTNCVVGIVELALADGIEWCDTQILGPDGRPRFVGTGDCPYEPRYSSPLRAHGKLLEWMTEDSVDLAGNARLRDGKVDIGAYQCWLDPVGALLLLR